jgi:hypothetical protein
MEDYKKIAEKLRYTKSESKRKLLDEAADTIERLEAERNELAIAALREQEERSKGCDFCREDNEGYYRMLGTFYLTNPFHKGEYYLNGGGRKPRKIAFCPMCGRKLEVEHEN